MTPEDRVERERLAKIADSVAAWASSDDGAKDAAAATERARRSAAPFRASRAIRAEYLRTPVTK